MRPVAAAIGSPAEEAAAAEFFSTALSSPSPVLLTCLKVKVTPRTCFGFVSLFYPLISIISAKENSGWPFPVFIHRPSWLEPLLYCFTFGPKLLPFPEGKQQACLRGTLEGEG